MRNLTTRQRIVLVLLVALLPATVATLYDALREKSALEAMARRDLQRLAMLEARHQEQIIEGARQTLVAASQILSELRGNPKACNAYFASLLRQNSRLYHSMGLFDVGGDLVCNAVPWQGRVTGSNRRYFTQALATQAFAVGDYQVGQVTRRQGINFGYPVTDAQGLVTAVAFIALDLGSFNRIAAATPLPGDGDLLVIDVNGTIIARHPAEGVAVGQRFEPAGARERVMSDEKGVFEARDGAGVDRLYAFQGMSAGPDGAIPMRVVVSTPMKVVFADANLGLVRTLVSLAVAAALLLLAAWIGADRLLLAPIRTMLETAARVRAGDLTARTLFRYRKDELSQLGLALDHMTQSLQDRDEELKRAMQELREQSITDPLTGLYNRRYLMDLLPRELKRAQRGGSMLAVIMVDLDHFKQVNDRFGHEAGDKVLRAVGGLLKERIRGSDTPCRCGGEEFVLILPEAATEGALQRAEDIRAAVKRLEVHGLDQPVGPVTASLGVALFPAHGDEADALLRAADEALYLAKGAGRDRVVLSGRPPARPA